MIIIRMNIAPDRAGRRFLAELLVDFYSNEFRRRFNLRLGPSGILCQEFFYSRQLSYDAFVLDLSGFQGTVRFAIDYMKRAIEDFMRESRLIINQGSATIYTTTGPWHRTGPHLP